MPVSDPGVQKDYGFDLKYKRELEEKLISTNSWSLTWVFVERGGGNCMEQNSPWAIAAAQVWKVS